MDITEQIKSQIQKKIVEQLSEVKPEIGVFRCMEDLRNKLKAVFPNEKQLDNVADTIAFINRFLTKDDIIIMPKFTNNKTGETYPAYKIPDALFKPQPGKSVISEEEKAVISEKPESSTSGWNKELFDFAFFRFNKTDGTNDFDKAVAKIARLAKKEVWQLAGEAESDKSLLKAYIKLMFSRLKYERDKLGLEYRFVEGEAIEKDNSGEMRKVRRCAINTGLISEYGKPIFMIFKANSRADKQPWVYEDVCVDSSDSRLLIPFKEAGKTLPLRANFSSNLTTSIATFSKPVVAVNKGHILKHCERLPLEFLKFHFKEYFDKKVPATDKEWDEFKKYLNDSANSRKLNAAWSELEVAINRAINEGHSDMKKAHIYRPENHTVSTFLPLYLITPKDEKDFEIGLIVDVSSGNNIASTIYPTSMAYAKIRVIGRQQSWLDPERINNWENPYINQSSEE